MRINGEPAESKLPGLTAGAQLAWPTATDEGLYAGVHRVIATVAALGGAVGWLHEPARAEVDRWLDALMGQVQDGRARLLVVRRDGRIEALGYWARLAGVVFERNAEVRKVMTHPDARGQGLARLVVRSLVRDAATAGVEVLVLDVRGNNHAALDLYESEGFTVYGRLPDLIAVGNERFDRVCFYRDLGRPPGVVRHGGRVEGPGASTGRGALARPPGGSDPGPFGA